MADVAVEDGRIVRAQIPLRVWTKEFTVREQPSRSRQTTRRTKISAGSVF